jgi:hypothetical protein
MNEIRYYDKTTRSETRAPETSVPHIIELPSDHIFFQTIPTGKKLVYVNDIPSHYIDIGSDLTAEQIKEQKIIDIKQQRDKDMSKVQVAHDSKEWSFSPVDMQRFESKIARNRNFNWKADDGSVVELTSTKAEEIATKVDDALTAIFFNAELEIDQLV